LRGGQLFNGLIAEHATGAATIATIAIAGTSALGSLHVPDGPGAPTVSQQRSALTAAAKQPAPPPRAKPPVRRTALEDEYGPREYGP
jgi:hypothetical protein